MPVIQDTYKDDILTDLVERYTNPVYMAQRIAPQVLLNKRTGQHFKFDKSNLRRHDAKRTGRSKTNEVDWNLSKVDVGPLQERSLKSFIEKDEFSHAEDPYEPRTWHAQVVKEGLLIDLEKEVADELADTTVLTNNTTLSGTDQWNDYDNSTPFDDIQTAIDSVVKNYLRRPNAVWMSYDVFSKLKHHPDLLDRVKWSNTGIITEDILATLFDVEMVEVGAQSYNTAALGQSASLSQIWGKHFWTGFVNQNPDADSTPGAYHVLRQRDAQETDNWTENDPKGEYVRTTDYYDTHLVAAEGIYLVKNAVA